MFTPWINYGNKYLFMVSINKNNFGLNFNLRFTIAVYKVHIYMRDGRTSKKRLKKLLSVSLYTAFFGFQMIKRVTLSDFKHVFHIDRDTLAHVVLKIIY